MRLNSKGISLFTPLVGLMLFMITAMFVINMQTTAAVRTEEALDISDTQRVGDLISAMRTDGLQSIIAGVRESYANYFDSLECGKGMYIDEDLIGTRKDWQEIENDFIEKDIISEAGIINAISTELSSRLRYVNAQLPYKDYYITLKAGKSGVWYEIMQETLADAGVDAYKIIDCDSSKNCDNGAFYIVLDTSTISDETFNRMPAIELERQGEIKVEPLLPQGRKIPIYVQFRLFKALANTTEVYNKIRSNQEDIFGSSATDGIQLGACDAWKCGTRTDPWGEDNAWCVDGYKGKATIFMFGKQDANVPYENCTNLSVADKSFRPIKTSHKIGNYSFVVSGKYNAYSPQYSVGEVTKQAVCFLAAQAMKEKDGMGPLSNDELKTSGIDFLTCGDLTGGVSYFEEGEEKLWEVTNVAVSTNGLGFKTDGERIISFDPYEKIGEGGKYRSKRVCAQDCIALSIVTGILGLQEVSQALEGLTNITDGGVWNQECDRDHTKLKDIYFNEKYMYCARPYTLQKTCFAMEDTKTEHGWKSSTTNYYFEMHMKPDNYEIVASQARANDELAAQAGAESCTSLDETCNSGYSSVTCTHNVVDNILGLEYYPPEYEEMCSPPGYGTCVSSYSGMAAIQAGACNTEGTAYSTALTTKQECVTEHCEDEGATESCINQNCASEQKAVEDALIEYNDCSYNPDRDTFSSTSLGGGVTSANWRADTDEMMKTCGGASTYWGRLL